MVNNTIKSQYIIVKNNKIEKLFSNCIVGLRQTLESKSKYIENSNGIRTHSPLVRKRTLNQLAKLASLAKLLSVCLRNKWLWVRILLPSLKLQIWRLLRERSLPTFRQTIECTFTLKLECLLSVCLRNKWLWVRILLPSLKLQIWRLLRERSLPTFRQTIECTFTLKLVRDLIITYNHMENILVLLFSTKMYLLTNLLVIVYYTIYYCLTMI